MNSSHHGEIDDVLARWAAAERAGDLAGLRAVIADGFTGVGPLGFTLTRTDWLDRHRPDGLRYDTFTLADVSVAVHGGAADVAIASVRLNSQGSYQGLPTPEALRVSLVLHRDSGQWRLALAHMSFIAGTTGAPPVPGRASQSAGTS